MFVRTNRYLAISLYCSIWSGLICHVLQNLRLWCLWIDVLLYTQLHACMSKRIEEGAVALKSQNDSYIHWNSNLLTELLPNFHWCKCQTFDSNKHVHILKCWGDSFNSWRKHYMHSVFRESDHNMTTWVAIVKAIYAIRLIQKPEDWNNK